MSKRRFLAYIAAACMEVGLLASCNRPLRVSPYTGGSLGVSDGGGNPSGPSPSVTPTPTPVATGTPVGTQLDSSGNLTLSPNTKSGTYTSQPIEMNGTGSWKTVGWQTDRPYGKEIPATTETAYKTGNANLSAIQTLLHFNESAPGASGFADASPLGANATCGSSCNSNIAKNCGPCPVPTPGGKFNGAVSFDGANTFLSLGTKGSLGGAASFSVSAWINVPNGYTGGGIIFQQRDSGSSGDNGSFQFFLGTNKENSFDNNPTALAGGLGFWTEDAQQGGSGGLRMVTAGSLINNGKWHHVAVVRAVNGATATATIYVDGAQVGQPGNGNADALTATNGVYVGWDAKQNANYFPSGGMLDEVAFYGRALTAAEVSDLFLRGALRVKLQFQSCDVAADCTPAGFTSATAFSELMNATPGFPTGLNLNLPNPSNPFLQYQITLESDVAASPTFNVGSIKLGQ